MRFVPNQRVPSSGYNTLNSITLNDYCRQTFLNTDTLCHSSMKEHINGGKEWRTIHINFCSLFCILQGLLFCTLYLKSTILEAQLGLIFMSTDYQMIFVRHNSSMTALLETTEN